MLRAEARERAWFGAILHMPLTREEYSQLTVVELQEFRELAQEINKAQGGR